MLFLGRDFERKAGPLVVHAFVELRKAAPECTLTVAGPDVWPIPGAVPEGVEFRGRLSPGEAAAALSDHDLFVMPSWFEPFGIVFAEALSAGLPCVARRVRHA